MLQVLYTACYNNQETHGIAWGNSMLANELSI